MSMFDYGNFLPEALKISTDPILRRLGNELDLFTSNDTLAADYTIGLRKVSYILI